MSIPRKLIGQILIEMGACTAWQVDEALQLQKTPYHRGKKVGDILEDLSHVTNEEITEALVRQNNIPTIQLTDLAISADVLSLVSHEDAVKYLILPIKRTGNILTIATADPLDVNHMEYLKSFLGMSIDLAYAAPVDIQSAIDRLYAV